MEQQGFSIQITQQIENITSACNLIVTTTPSTSPLVKHINKGTHITAVGADSPHKQEIASSIFGQADIIVADSITQCIERGDIAHAIKDGIIQQNKLIELGIIIAGNNPGRRSDEQITIADLTGLAVQDIAIAKTIFKGIVDELPSLVG
jgi:ornithine cyclodeaminase